MNPILIKNCYGGAAVICNECYKKFWNGEVIVFHCAKDAYDLCQECAKKKGLGFKGNKDRDFKDLWQQILR